MKLKICRIVVSHDDGTKLELSSARCRLSNNSFEQSGCFSTPQRFRDPNRTLVSKKNVVLFEIKIFSFRACSEPSCANVCSWHVLKT